LRRLRAAVARGSGRFGAPQTLLSVRANLSGYRVLPIASGRYLAIWWQGDPRTGRHPVRYTLSSAKGRFAPARTLARDTGPLTRISAAVGPDESALAAWGTPLSSSPVINQQLDAAILPPGGSRFGPPLHIRAQRADNFAETDGIVAFGGPGGTALGWLEQGSLPELVRAAFGPFPPATSGGPTPETVLTVESNDLGKAWAEGPALALPASGEPLAAWDLLGGAGGESERTTSGRIFAADRAPDGTYGPARRVSAPGTIATQLQAAASQTHAVVTWTIGPFPRYSPQFAVRDATGAFGPARPLTRDRMEDAPRLAASPAAVLAAWATRARRRSDRRVGKGAVIAVAVLARR
jgi:hypothetical protein